MRTDDRWPPSEWQPALLYAADICDEMAQRGKDRPGPVLRGLAYLHGLPIQRLRYRPGVRAILSVVQAATFLVSALISGVLVAVGFLLALRIAGVTLP